MPEVSGTPKYTYNNDRKHHPAKKMKAPHWCMLLRMDGVALKTAKKKSQWKACDRAEPKDRMLFGHNSAPKT